VDDQSSARYSPICSSKVRASSSACLADFNSHASSPKASKVCPSKIFESSDKHLFLAACCERLGDARRLEEVIHQASGHFGLCLNLDCQIDWIVRRQFV